MNTFKTMEININNRVLIIINVIINSINNNNIERITANISTGIYTMNSITNMSHSNNNNINKCIKNTINSNKCINNSNSNDNNINNNINKCICSNIPK